MFKIEATYKCDCGNVEMLMVERNENKPITIELYKCNKCRNRNKRWPEITHAQQMVPENDY